MAKSGAGNGPVSPGGGVGQDHAQHTNAESRLISVGFLGDFQSKPRPTPFEPRQLWLPGKPKVFVEKHVTQMGSRPTISTEVWESSRTNLVT